MITFKYYGRDVPLNIVPSIYDNPNSYKYQYLVALYTFLYGRPTPTINFSVGDGLDEVIYCNFNKALEEFWKTNDFISINYKIVSVDS